MTIFRSIAQFDIITGYDKVNGRFPVQ